MTTEPRKAKMKKVRERARTRMASFQVGRLVSESESMESEESELRGKKMRKRSMLVVIKVSGWVQV
jgi:hypothetical protein